MKSKPAGTRSRSPKAGEPKIHLEEAEVASRKEPAVPKAPGKGNREDPKDVEERQAAFDSMFDWKGTALLPYSIGRESAFSQLRIAMGAPPLAKCFDPDDTMVFLPDALRILFLCSHEPEIWMILRAEPARLQMAVDAWAEANVGLEDRLSAVTTALNIHNAAHRNVHEPAPVRHSHGDDLGN